MFYHMYILIKASNQLSRVALVVFVFSVLAAYSLKRGKGECSMKEDGTFFLVNVPVEGRVGGVSKAF